MDISEIRRLHGELVGRNYGSLQPEEVAWLQELVVRHQPRRVLEVGTASGMTTGFLAAMLDENGGEEVVTIEDKGRGIGPKHLYDQFPESHRERAPVSGGNMFVLSPDLPDKALEDIAVNAFGIPWTLTNVIADDRLEAIRAVLGAHYSPALLGHFDECVEKYNVATGRVYRRRPARDG